MKTLFCNRDPKSWIGGDMVQLEKTREALGKLGVETRFTSLQIPNPEDIADVDIVHCFNFSMPWTKFQIWQASRLKKKIVVSMVYHETDSFVDYQTQQAMVHECHALLFLTEGEVARAKRHLDIPNEKIFTVPNGVDRFWFEAVKPKACGVLTVGRIDENKGQLAVAKACRKLGLHYTCIGERSRYAALCEVEGAEVLGPLKPEEIRPYYAGCNVFVLASLGEIMPLTVMEAGAQGCPIVLTSGCEWQVPAEYVTYNSVGSIANGIERASARGVNAEFRATLEGMTWEKAALEIKRIYETL
jgi:glycosyltransferase involved in cell wall biosynthesis